MNGELDVVLVAKGLDHVERFGRRFGDEGLDSQLAAELEDFSATGLVAWNLRIEECWHPHTGRLHLQADLRQFVVREVAVEILRHLLADLLKTQPADVRRGQVHESCRCLRSNV